MEGDKTERKLIMKFSDIDFSAISRMMDSMSDEEKDRLNNMAQEMMDNMKNEQESEQEEDMYAFYGINEEDYKDVPGIVLDQMEEASDLEGYYEDVKDEDFSASVLFLSKAVLNMLRHYHFSIYKNVLEISKFSNPNMTTVYDFLYPLMNDETIQKLCDEGFGESSMWIEHRSMLQQIYTALNRAEYDFINYETLQEIKSILFDKNGLLNITKLI